MSDDENLSYPLRWPVGWPRAKYRHDAPFRRGKDRLSVAAALDRLMPELERLHTRDVIISTNVRPTLSGYPSSKEGQASADPGAAVYFRLLRSEDRKVLACDKWTRLADNLAAIAAHVEALRGQERWGVGSIEQAFAGYKALAAVSAKQPWWSVLGLAEDAPPQVVKDRWLNLLGQHHPDVRGGNGNRAAEINVAYQEARAAGRAP